MIPKKLTQNGWCVWRVKTNKTDWGYGIGSMIGKATSESFTMKERYHRTAKNKAPDNRGILLHSLRENIQSKTKGSKSQDYWHHSLPCYNL